MKTIFLIRHAKSSWKNQFLEDHERPLNKRGLSDAPRMGEKLRQSYPAPEKILCSNALRAQETAKIIQKIWFPKKTIDFSTKLYEQPTSNILKVINESSNNLDSLALFFHNPTITHLANLLASLDIHNVPTCGVVTLSCLASNWKSVEVGKCHLVDFDYPKKNS